MQHAEQAHLFPTWGGAKKLPRTYAVRGSYGFLCSFRSGYRKYPYRQVRQFAIEKREIMQVNSARVALPVGSRIPPVRPFMMPFTFAQRMAGTA